MKTLYLIGFMGSGKSTVGRQLSQKLGKTFVDIDEFIEKKYRMSISTLFEKYGENTFRQYEIDALKSCNHYSVVATGGGIIERQENINTMKCGTIVYLKASFEEIERRLKNDQTRPLWNDQSKQAQKNLYKKRLGRYEQLANLEIETTNKRISDIIAEIITTTQE